MIRKGALPALALLALGAATPACEAPPAPARAASIDLDATSPPPVSPAAVPVDAGVADAPLEAALDAATAAVEPEEAAAPPAISRLRAPPGACVDPEADAARRLHMPVDWFHGNRDMGYGADVDGDGVDDAFVFGGAVSITSTMLLYVRRGACGHYVGTMVFEGWPRPAEDGAVHHGLVDLEASTVCRVGSCCGGAVARWVFSGRLYVPAGRRTKPPCGPDPVGIPTGP